MQTPAFPLPTHGKKRANPDTANNQNDPKQSLRKANPAPQPISRGRAAKQEAHRKIQIVENWYKIWPHLQNTPIMEVPTTGHVQSLLPLDLQRDVVFNRKAPVYFERRSQDISALIIQMTGVEAPRPCTRCQQGNGPFSGCFLISPEAHPETRKQITSCANCFYKGHQSRCSEFIRQQKETPPESQGENTSAAENDVNVQTEQQTPARRSGRNSNRPDAASPPKPATENIPRPDQPMTEITRAVAPRSVYDLSMEEWEIAPGRITEPSGSGIEKNFIFSGAYLAHGEEVRLTSRIGAHVHVLKPGTMHRFTPTPHRSRVCFVTSGKVLVKTPHGEYPTGQGGLFAVDPDKSCTVQNRLYIDATLSIVVTHSEE
ncbi:hypothetical protein BJ166DRAFT_505684 [Pestalotiopsis sp. NC0098]|nr:hypothetical protein BJ166DRAFT_505684 [Pestalotiopsis sp. NC0098]